MSNIDPKVIVTAMLRQQAGKPPLVARNGRVVRHRFFPRLRRALVRWALVPFPRYHVKLKWRWSRGEIRDRRLRALWVRKYMVPPITRHINYSEIGRKAFQVEKLPEGDMPVYE